MSSSSGSPVSKQIKRIELEIRILKARQSPAKSYSTARPKAKLESITLPEIDLNPLQTSFNPKNPSFLELEIFLRSNGVLPLIDRFLKNVDAIDLRDRLHSCDGDIGAVADQVVLSVKEMIQQMKPSPTSASLLTVAHYAKLLANKNQDILVNHFGLDVSKNYWKIIRICATIVVLAFRDTDLRTNGFFTVLRTTELIWPMSADKRVLWESKYRLPATEPLFVQEDESEIELQYEYIAKLFQNVYSFTKHTEFRMGEFDGEEELTFFKCYDKVRDATYPMVEMAQFMFRRNAWECAQFLSRDGVKARLSNDKVDDPGVDSRLNASHKRKAEDAALDAQQTEHALMQKIDEVNELLIARADQQAQGQASKPARMKIDQLMENLKPFGEEVQDGQQDGSNTKETSDTSKLESKMSKLRTKHAIATRLSSAASKARIAKLEKRLATVQKLWSAAMRYRKWASAEGSKAWMRLLHDVKAKLARHKKALLGPLDASAAGELRDEDLLQMARNMAVLHEDEFQELLKEIVDRVGVQTEDEADEVMSGVEHDW